MNIFERLPIHRLVTIIGERQLKDVEGVLEALNRPDLNVDMINTRGFLSAFANQVLGARYLLSGDGVVDLFSSLAKGELDILIGKLSIPNSFDSREDSIQFLINYKFNARAKKIVNSFLGYSEYEIESNNSQGKSGYLLLTGCAAPYKPLKDYQFEVLFEAVEKLKVRDSRFILQMPTGSGKTRTAMEIVSQFLNENCNGSVIWLAHSTELCDQASDCFLEVWPHVATRELEFVRHYGEHKLQQQPIGKIVGFLCSSFQSLLGLIDTNQTALDKILGGKRLIVVDEAHKVIAPTYRRVTKALISDGAAVMGLTATPGRSYNANQSAENEELAQFFFYNSISFYPHGMDPIQYLRDKKVLAKAKLEPLLISGVDVLLTPTELNYISKTFELPGEVLSRLGKNSFRNAEILNRIVRLVTEGEARSIIFFATSIEQSKLINSLLKFLQVASEHLDGTTPRIARQEIVADFRLQKIQVLCNYEVLSTGFDAPLVDCVFIARPTASVVLYSQMIGRGLRGPAIGGKEKCLIVNVRDNFANFPNVETMYKIFDDYWV